MKSEFINREKSWLSFNERVLQEAEDKTNPLVERFRFLGIFSSNRDEFFRVRVATVKRLVKFSYKDKNPQYKNSDELLKEIQGISAIQQTRFEKTYNQLETELKSRGIFIIDETEILDEHKAFVHDYFHSSVYPALVPIMLNNVIDFPFLKDKEIYLAVQLKNSKSGKKEQYAIIEVPSAAVGRFLVLPEVDGKKYILLLDDVIRFCLADIFLIFDYETINAYTIKITRDAELDLDNDVSKSFIDQMKRSLKQRKLGEPVRLVYDQSLPERLMKYLVKHLGMDNDDNFIPGGRYHNFKDFMKFPNVGSSIFEFKKNKQLEVKAFKKQGSILNVVSKQDVLVHYPYQSFKYFVDLLREAAIDPKVKSIKITAYRLANDSKVVNTLVNAARNGKKVIAVIELQARFDEENNIHWSNILQENGVTVLHGKSGLKIHSKICLITRKESGETKNYACVGTGNFHEGTAQIYSDISLFTADERIANEVRRVFDIIEGALVSLDFEHLVLSPINLRNQLGVLIKTEIENAKKGKPAFIQLKLNSLVDNDLIVKLYKASNAGVKIKLIVRGICCLVPGVKGYSENIQAISILDKFLEHTRIFIFGNDDQPKYYIASADWMARNLDRRIEVCCPIYSKDLQNEILNFMDTQFTDNVKARMLDKDLLNKYQKTDSNREIRTQFEMYNYYQKQLER